MVELRGIDRRPYWFDFLNRFVLFRPPHLPNICQFPRNKTATSRPSLLNFFFHNLRLLIWILNKPKDRYAPPKPGNRRSRTAPPLPAGRADWYTAHLSTVGHRI